MNNEPFLSQRKIKHLVQEKLNEYEDLDILEQYAMFLGKSQILEFGLKGLLTRKYDISSETMENWTLGRVKNELDNKGIRTDFISLLTSVVDYRNFIAHEFLLNNAITKSFANFAERKLYGDLFHAIYELEQIIVLYDWTEKHNGWKQ